MTNGRKKRGGVAQRAKLVCKAVRGKSNRVVFAARDSRIVYRADLPVNSLLGSSYSTIALSIEDEYMRLALATTSAEYEDRLLARTTTLNFEPRFKSLLKDNDYPGRGMRCAAALAIGIVRKLTRNKEAAESFAECMLDLFSEKRLEVELISYIGDHIAAHKDAMSEQERVHIATYYCLID